MLIWQEIQQWMMNEIRMDPMGQLKELQVQMDEYLER